MVVTVVGGGNIGHYLLALIGSKGHEVRLLTSKPDRWAGKVESVDTIHNVVICGNISHISSCAADVIPGADMILVALPSNAYERVFIPIKKYIGEGTMVGFIPGTGGVEFICRDLLDRRCIVFGTQRVPSGTSIVEYGKKVNSLGSRKDLRVAAIPKEKTEYVCDILADLLNIQTLVLPNYLSVTLTPSNPILHTSRLSTLLVNYRIGDKYPEQLSFYKAWSNESSKMLIGCDDELQEALSRIPLDTKEILSLKDHYEIWTVDGKNDVERMTNKINILPYLKDKVPMKMSEGGYEPDLDSRYFQEDFPYGLCIVKSFCDICGIITPHVDWVLRWFCSLFGKEYFLGNSFSGKDLKGLYIPKNFGINTIEDIQKYYDI